MLEAPAQGIPVGQMGPNRTLEPGDRKPSTRDCPIWGPPATCSHLNTQSLKRNKIKISPPGTFQMLNSHMWLVAPVLDSAGMEFFHHHRMFHWTMSGWAQYFRLEAHRGRLVPLTQRKCQGSRKRDGGRTGRARRESVGGRRGAAGQLRADSR